LFDCLFTLAIIAIKYNAYIIVVDQDVVQIETRLGQSFFVKNKPISLEIGGFWFVLLNVLE